MSEVKFPYGNRRAVLGQLAALSSTLVVPQVFSAQQQTRTGPFLLGRGYRSFADGFGDYVIDVTPQALAPPSESSTQGKFGFIGSQDDFEQAVSVDAEVSGGYGAFSANAKASLSKQYSRELNAVSIALTKLVVRGIYRLTQYPLNQDARKTAAQFFNSASDYVRIYGDQIVTGVGVGGACCYIFKYVFGSEKEATEFKMSVGVTYATASASASIDTKTLMSKMHAITSLSGYSTGTINVPHLAEGTQSLQGKNFLFNSDFSEGIMRNLLQYFDNFESNFKFDATDKTNSRAYSEAFTEKTSLYVIHSLFRNQTDILNVARQADAIAATLRSKKELAENLRTQLSYMQSSLTTYNTADNLGKAPGLVTQLDNVIQAIDARQKSLVETMDVASPYGTETIPNLPLAFCTADPLPRFESHDDVPWNTWVIYLFKIGPADMGRSCFVQAIAKFYHVRFGTGFSVARVRFLKKKAGAAPSGSPIVLPPNIDTTAEWDTVEEPQQPFKVGKDTPPQQIPMPTRPTAFIASPDVTYAVAVWYEWSLAGHGIDLRTYIGQQAPT